MAATETLQRLAGTPVRSLVGKDESGRRILTYHYEACCTSRLVPSATAADDVARLHAIFDVALACGLTSLVVDYIAEVCSDANLTSSEPLEAYLLDGECVGQWCTGALAGCNRRVRAALERQLKPEDASVMRVEAARLEALVSILEALSPSDRPGAGVAPGIEDAKLLLQCTKVLRWAVEAGLPGAGATGRFSSRQEWQLTANRRRDALQPAASSLQDLLAALQHHGAARNLAYPPASWERGVEGLFLSGDATPAAFQAKLAVLLYYLLDAGHFALLDSFRAAFGIPTGELAVWQASFLLDEAALQLPGSSALDTACNVLLEAAQAEIPLKAVRALAELGRPQTALQLLRGRARVAAADPEAALAEAITAVSILLSAGLVTEAYLQVRRHCSKLGGERVRDDTEALVSCLAEWAAAAGNLGAIICLPLLDLEEEAMVAWLEEQVAEATPLAEFAPLFYLQRQRLPEALHAFARLAPEPAGSQASGRRAALGQALEAAGKVVPQAQACLVLHPPGQQPGLSLQGDGSHGSGPLAPTAKGVPLHSQGSFSQQPPLFGPLAEPADESGHALPQSTAAGQLPLPEALPPTASMAVDSPEEPGSGLEGGFGSVQPASSAPRPRDWNSMMGLGGGALQGRPPRSRRR